MKDLTKCFSPLQAHSTCTAPSNGCGEQAQHKLVALLGGATRLSPAKFTARFGGLHLRELLVHETRAAFYP